jgi:hypothetical protein
MKKFFMELLSANSPLSSKRFAGLLTLLSCIILAFTAAFKSNGICPDTMYNGLLLVVAGLFGFNMAESIFKKSDSKIADAAKDIPEEEQKEIEDKVE